jgi:hypothetical protein
MAAPVLQNRNPAPGALYHYVAEDLRLEVVDADADLVALSVKIWLQEQIVWENDAQQAGFTVTKTSITNGFRYQINPASDLTDGRKYSIRVYAQDAIPNTLDETYYFTAGSLRIGPAEDQSKMRPVRDEAGVEDDDAVADTLAPFDRFRSPWSKAKAAELPGAQVADLATRSYSNEWGPQAAVNEAGIDADSIAPRSAQGPSSHLLTALEAGLGGGARIPGPSAQQAADASQGVTDDSSVDDAHGFATAGGPTRYQYPQVGRGLLLAPRDEPIRGPQDDGVTEDGVYYDVGSVHTYMKDVKDSDANDTLGGYGVMQALLYRAALDAWATPGAGFYGYGKEGVCYHDGLSTQPGVFGLGAGQFNRRSWNDNQGLLAIENVDGDAAMIAADTLRIASTGLTGYEGVSSALRWYLTGDFDITISFANFSASASANAAARFSVVFDDGYAVFISRRGDGYYERYVKINGTWGNQVTAATVVTSGQLRLTRTGTSVRTYYWNGSSWTELGGSVNMSRSDRGYVYCYNYGSGAVNVSIDWSVFVITSGTWTNQATWATEAFSSTRGNLDGFPDNALIVCSKAGLDIIDTDTDKLWMRFVGGTNSLLRTAAGVTFDCRMKEGVLVVAYRDDAGSEGDLIVIDFTLDQARVAREDASGITGGYLDAPSGQGAGSGRAGSISSRNAAVGFTGDYARWATQDYEHNGCAQLHDSGKVYLVSANNEGLRVFRYTRWNLQAVVGGFDQPDYSSWTEARLCYWAWFRPQDAMLFWVGEAVGGTTLYAISKTGFETPMHAGSFAAAASDLLPSRRSCLSQYRPAISGASVYLAADDGAWKKTWPGGSWGLLFGKPGSGAVYEHLPEDMSRVTSVLAATDGSLDILLLGVETGTTSQVLVYRLDTGALYAKLPVDGAKTAVALAA